MRIAVLLAVLASSACASVPKETYQAVRPAQRRSPAPVAFASTRSAYEPEPETRPAMARRGVVMTGVGSALAVTGAVTLAGAGAGAALFFATSPEFPAETLAAPLVGAVVVGGLELAVGIPLLVFGASAVEEAIEPLPATGLVVPTRVLERGPRQPAAAPDATTVIKRDRDRSTAKEWKSFTPDARPDADEDPESTVEPRHPIPVE